MRSFATTLVGIWRLLRWASGWLLIALAVEAAFWLNLNLHGSSVKYLDRWNWSASVKTWTKDVLTESVTFLSKTYIFTMEHVNRGKMGIYGRILRFKQRVLVGKLWFWKREPMIMLISACLVNKCLLKINFNVTIGRPLTFIKVWFSSCKGKFLK